MKKILTIVGIILLLSFIILGLWYLFTTKKDNDSDGLADDIDQSGTFFPDSQNGSPTPLFNSDDSENGQFQDSSFIPQFRQLSQVPVSGMISFERLATSSDTFINEGNVVSTATETVFRYIERGTGHVFETTERTITQERISNITLPQIQKALFDSSGSRLFIQFFANDNETIRTFTGEISEIATTTDGGTAFKDSKLDTDFFSNGLYDIVPSYNNASVFSLSKNDNGAIVENTSFDVPVIESVTSLLLSNWNIQSPNNSILALTTKANSEISGYLYFYNISTGRKTRILGPLNGLTTNTSPSGKFVLFSTIRAGKVELSIYNTEDATVGEVVVQTLPEKCVWKESNEIVLYCAVPSVVSRNPLPESWYQGLTSFNDDLWKITLREGDSPSYQTILEPSSVVNTTFDITELQLSSKEEYLLFVNKNDLNLWSFDVTSF